MSYVKYQSFLFQASMCYGRNLDNHQCTQLQQNRRYDNISLSNHPLTLYYKKC